MYDTTHFTRDAADAVWLDTDASGISDSDDGVEIDWDAVETVTIDDPPYEAAFDTNEFYKLPSTVAKPIPQPYEIGDEAVWLLKPREELQRAAWSLDNASFTLGHPETGMVKDVNDVHGFWRDSRYDGEANDLNTNLMLPTNDDEAKAFVSDNPSLSVGFYNKITPVAEYDGVVDAIDSGRADDVEGYQTDMIFDHVAAVRRGRCSLEHGCGVGASRDDAEPHGHAVATDEHGGLSSVMTEEQMTGSEEGLALGDRVEHEGRMWEVVDIERDGCIERDGEELCSTDDEAVLILVADNDDKILRRIRMADLRIGRDHTLVADEMSVGSWAEWDASGGTTYGKVDEIVREGCTSRGKGDQEVCAEEDDPAVVLEVYDDETGESKDELVRHRMSELRSWSGPSNDAAPTVSTDAFISATSTTQISDRFVSDAIATLDAPSGIHEADGKWFAVGPDEHSDDSTEYADDAKYPVNSCADVEDAWNLRGSGHMDIERSTLEARIKRVADALDCDGMPWESEDSLTDRERALAAADSAKRYSVCGSRWATVAQYRSECGCDAGRSTADSERDNEPTLHMTEVTFDELGTDAAIAKLTEQHDGAAERIEQIRAAADAAESAVAELDSTESVEDLADSVALLEERKQTLEEQVDSLEAELDELRRPEMEADAEYIAERTDRFGETAEEVIERLDEDPDAVADKRELVEDLTEGLDTTTANSGSGGSTEKTTDSGKYARTPWE